VFIANLTISGTWLEAEELHQFSFRNARTCTYRGEWKPILNIPCDQGLPDASQWLDEFPRLIVQQDLFQNLWAVAGIRVGYSLSSPEIADMLNRIRQPFSVNSLACGAPLLLLQDPGVH
jgi:histidinol-phosphate aminotransferase